MSGKSSYQKKEKENECPRFKQHNDKGSTDNGDKARRSKGSSVVTFSQCSDQMEKYLNKVISNTISKWYLSRRVAV